MFTRRAYLLAVFWSFRQRRAEGSRADDRLQNLIKAGTPNDIAKFALPDAYKTELTWTINARSLQNFLKLRTAPSAMWEIRRLANAVYDALPGDHKYIFAECLHPQEDKQVATS